MKKLIFTLGLALFFTACGGGGGGSIPSLPSVDNSKLTLTSANYGYFGENVQFGDYTAARNWIMYGLGKTDNNVYLTIYDDGRIRTQVVGENQNRTVDGAVSNNGLQIMFEQSFSSEPGTVTITSRSDGTQTVTQSDGTKTVYKCYNVTVEEFLFDDSNYQMCPYG